MPDESQFNFNSFIDGLGRYIGAEALVETIRKVESEISVFLNDKDSFGAGPSAFRVAIFPKGESPSSTHGDKREFFGLAEVYDTYNYLKQEGVTEEEVGMVRGRVSKFINMGFRRLTGVSERYHPLTIDELEERIHKRQKYLGL